MALLARREHAPAELAAKLQRRGFDSADVAHVLAALSAEDLLSAQRYATAVVNARSARGYGPLRIRNELAQKQIDEQLIEQALAAAEVDWFALAVATCAKRFGTAAAADYKERARRMRFLQRRGFDFDCIRAAVADAG